MRAHHPLLLTAAIAAAALAPTALARDARGLVEISDAELGDMRGRFTVGGNRVAWFGVTMVSTWQTSTGNTLQGALTFGMRFGPNGQTPVVSFQPSVSISSPDAPLPTPADGRSIDAAGLGNPTGIVQSVQLAGDGNLAGNLLQIDVRDGEAPEGYGVQGTDGNAALAGDGFALSAGVGDGRAPRILLRIDGVGAVEQWLGAQGIGQQIQLAADGQQASNRMRIELVREAMPAGSVLDQNVAQAIALSRGLQPGGY